MSAPAVSHILRLLASHKQLRYLVSGVISEAIEYAVFAALFLATHWLFVANSVGFIAGIASGFWLHKQWSFAGEHQFKTRHQLVIYLALAGANLVAANLLVGWLVDGLNVAALIAKPISMVIIACWSFVVFNKIIFRQQQ